MSTATEKQATIEDLKESFNAAQQRHRELVQEHRELPTQLRNASRRAARQKADAARNGDSGQTLTTTAADLDAHELRDREAALPFEIWAQQLVVAELDADLHRAELAAVEEELKNTGPAYESARQDLADAEQRMAQAYSAHTSAASRASTLSVKIRDANLVVAELEENAPGA